MSFFVGRRRLLPTQVDFSKVVSGSVAGVASFIALDSNGKLVLGNPADYFNVSIASAFAGSGLASAAGVINIGQGTGITVAADAISTNDSQIIHDNLSGFVANEHIDHSGVTITAGNGLTGGGDITTTRTLTVGEGTGITVASTTVSTNDSEIVHDNLSGFVANEHIDHSGVSITAGDGLTGGGTIASTRTLAVGQGTGISVSSDAVATNDSEIVHDNLSGFVANEHIDHSGVTITAGNGLTGGGTIASTRTLAVGQGTGISVSSDAVATNDSEIVHDNLSGFVANEHIDHSTVSITAGTGLSGGGTIASTRTLSTNDSEIVHDNLSGFVANEHIDHSGVSITAGDGLTGGGTIASTRTVAVGQGTGITVNANDIATNDSEIVHDNLSGFVANEHINHTSVTITAGNGLTGGGNISANRTIAVGAGTGIDVTANAVSVDVSDFMTNGSNNRVLTATGADAMNAEANLTFDGSVMECNATLRVSEYISHIGDTDTRIRFTTDNISLDTANSTAINIDSSGHVTKPLQPCFRATKSSVQSNISVNTRVVVTFDGENFDRGSNFASNAFTAPVAGIYLFGGHADFDELDISATQILMSLEVDPADGGSTYYVDLDQKDPNEYNTDMERFSTIGSTLFELAANDVVKLTVYQGGGAAISDIGTRSRFWGTLIN